MDLSNVTTRELLTIFGSAMRELKERGLVRTANNPVADLAELLFCRAMKWERGHHQGKDIDAVMKDGSRVQIKARRITRGTSHSRSGSIRDREGWDWIALAIFNEDFSLNKAVLVEHEIADRHLKWSSRQNAYYISLTNGFWTESGLMDVTAQLIKSAEELFSASRLTKFR